MPTAVRMLVIHYPTGATRRVDLHTDREDELRERVVRAAEAALAHHQYVSAIDVLTGTRLLAPTHVESWRKGRIDFLERVIQANLKKISQLMAMFRQWALANGLKPSETCYVRRTRAGTVDLQFSKSGDPAIERSYRTHYVSPALSERKQQQITEKLSRPAQPVVFEILRDSECSECGTELARGCFLFMEAGQPLCLPCARLDDLEYLPAGDAALTLAEPRRAETSSTLGASRKFRDTLAGRKRDIWLAPMCLADLKDADRPDLHHRLLRGGLPPFFLADQLPERDFQEWMDAYWAKDIQELFRLESRSSFQKFVELVLAQSGGIFEATRFSRPCEVSRPTISTYLKVLEATFVAHVIRPFSTHRATEIVSAPKVYGFDTGFVCYYRGWQELRPEDLGVLWEHFVLNEIMANLQTQDVHYWRDKRGHEVDFVLTPRRGKPLAIECKRSASDFDAANLLAFRKQYPQGENVVVAPDVDRTFQRSYREIIVRFESLRSLTRRLTS